MILLTTLIIASYAIINDIKSKWLLVNAIIGIISLILMIDSALEV